VRLVVYCVQFLSRSSVKLLRYHALRGMASEAPQFSGLSFGMSALVFYSGFNRLNQDNLWHN